MFHSNTDVKANLKLLTITELRSILQALRRHLKRGWRAGGGGATNLHVLSDYVALISILFKTIIISTP